MEGMLRLLRDQGSTHGNRQRVVLPVQVLGSGGVSAQGRLPAMTKPTCSHCGKPQRGRATVVVAGVPYPVCHVNPKNGMDCYRLVTVHSHMVLSCPCIVDEEWLER